MSSKPIVLADTTRLMAHELTETEVVNNAQTSRPVLVQAISVLGVGVQPQPICPHFETTGNSKELEVDGSGTPVEFFVTPTAPDIYRIDSIKLAIVCNTTPVTLSGFGNLTALTNGITIEVIDKDDAVIFDVLGGPILSGNDLTELGDVAVVENDPDFSLIATIKPVAPIRLKSGVSERLRLTVNDNLVDAEIDRIRARAFGVKENVRA